MAVKESFKGFDQFVKKEEKESKKEEKQEKKESPISQESKVEEPRKEREAVVIRSELDTYINERMKNQSTALSDLQFSDTDPHEEAKKILSLPKQLERYADKYAFRWLNKRKRAIDYALDVVGWRLCNRVLFPELPDYMFTANGTIERGDCILALIPLHKAREIRLRPSIVSRERLKSLPVQDLRKWKDTGSEHHYKPDLGAAEKDDEQSRGITVTPDAEIIETQE